MTFDFVYGTTEPQDMRVLEDREPFDGSGFEVGIEFAEDADVTEEQLEAIEVDWLEQAAGTVRVTGLDALDVGSYGFRFMLTDSGAKVGYAPNGAARNTLRVVRV